MGDVAAAVKVQELSPGQRAMLELIDRQKREIERALPKHIGVERFHRIVLTEVKRNPKLLRCEPITLLGGLMVAAQLGLEPGPLGHVYFVPFGNKKRGTVEAQFILGYQGMIELARRSGQVASIQAYPVYEGDEFDYALGTDPYISHKPSEDKPGDLTHVYAVAHYKDGGYNFEVLTRARVDYYRGRSRAKNDGPWVSDYEAMALKTAIRRLWRWLPKSPEMAAAVAVDEQAVTQIAPFEDTVETILLEADGDETDDSGDEPEQEQTVEGDGDSEA